MDYAEFVQSKRHEGADGGLPPTAMPAALFDYQRSLVEWSIRKGRAALLVDCGLGKTPMQLTWADNVARHTGRPVLVLAPLAVGAQTVREGAKFGIECARAQDGTTPARIVVTNYERIGAFDPACFGGVVCDESSILKSFEGARRSEVTAFMRKVPYRLLATATAAPNDYMELGTSSEALGYLGHMDMLNRFFVNDQQNSATRRMYGEAPKWRFKGHGQRPFWRWVASWARACRKPSDLGFADGALVLPALKENYHVVKAATQAPGSLFTLPAGTLAEQREERKRTVRERCEKVAQLVPTSDQALVWCHLNDEGDLLAELIPGAVQVSGADSDESKEEKFLAFADGKARVLVTKPKIGAWGLNFQRCNRVFYFPSHSFESYYQAVRRCWRFGQTRTVSVDLVLTEGEVKVMDNLRRKAGAADEMFSALVAEMNAATNVEPRRASAAVRVPAWIR